MAQPKHPSPVKLDLETANILIVGSRQSEQDILAQMLVGFGVRKIQRCGDTDAALDAAHKELFDLALIDAGVKGMGGYDLINAIRRTSPPELKLLPIILMQGHIKQREVFQARDCGANFVISKPLSSQVLFDRIIWLIRDRRMFVDCESYVGPDRRIKSFGPPVGIPGRRAGDLSATVGEAKEANLSQDAVDDFFSPKKVAP